MPNSVRRPFLALAALLLPFAGAAAETWEAPAFSATPAQLLQAAKDVRHERASDVVVLLDERIFVLDEQHRLTRTSRLIYRVDSPNGVERWAASAARWQPWHQARPRIQARVVTRDGRQHELDPNLLTESGTRDAGTQVYDDDHMLEGPLPAVEVGAVVEEEITVRDEKPFFDAGAVYREFVGRPVPVEHTRIVIDVPETLPLKRLAQLLPNARVQESRANGRVRWTLEQGPLDERAAMVGNLPSDVPGWPSVEFSTGRSWEAVAASYRAMTESRIRPGDAQPLIAGLSPSAPDFVAKVVERLHREVRYTGVEFGAARLIPAFPAETLRRRFGDCKDKSTLLVAALRASGIDAYLALLSAGEDQDVAPDLPGLGMFDHAIVYVPRAGDVQAGGAGRAGGAGDADLWIDATAEHARVGTLPAADANRMALVIRDGEKTLMRTPALRSQDNRQIETREFFLAEYGPARVIETTETHGIIEGEYRGWYAGADTKSRLDDLKTYAHDAYRARQLVNYEHTASNDFSKPYTMTIELKDAPIGFTDLETAAVGINVANITARLPEYFDSRLEPGEKEDAPRTADVVIEPFVTEWRYRIRPPPGFKARKLPPSGLTHLGPATLSSEFQVVDGAVHAVWRFDTVKGRFTPAETDALLKALRQLSGTETQLIAFDQVGVALRADGDFKGALQANEALTRAYPRKAVHRLRNSSALLDAGLGARAQREALAATKLEPTSALAWKTLGWMLQHDAVGRRFGEGYDRAGAIAAYRKARELDPGNTDITADLAVLLEHDADGVRYSTRANVNEAIAEYQARRERLPDDDAKSDDYANNLYYALLYAHRYEELRETLRAQPAGLAQRALTITALAAERGGAQAAEVARELVSGESDRRAALASAGNILTRLREYAAAADLIEASTRGQTTTAANTQRIALLRKTTRNDGSGIRASDPKGVVLRSFVELLSNRGVHSRFRALLSRRSGDLADAPENFERAQRAIIAGLTQQDLPTEVGVDLLFSNVRVNVEGDDAHGYRVQLRAAGDTQSFYVVKEDGAYRILTVAPMVGPLALMALERIDANDFGGARRWLDWARLELRAGNSEDPLEGPAFARAWTVGAESDLAAARAAAAMLLADCALGAKALPLLESIDIARLDSADRLGLDLAFAKTFLELGNWTGLQAVATRLVKAVPTSALAFRYQQWAGIQLQQWSDVEAASRERLARMPDDSIAREMLVHRAEALGLFAEIPAIMQPLIDSGRATAADYNQYAWSALLRQPVTDQAVEAARMAYDETQGRSAAIGHTLACVYAASGKPREARDLLLKGMEQVGITRPDDPAWYGFGLVAEAYGDAESARDYYAHVQKPKKGVIQASSVYALSQARLAALPR
jgi:transglutaminase-like putative cysteine protease